MPSEREIKLRLNVDLRSIQRKLRESGFHISKKRVFETNVVFDTNNASLRSSGKLLRLRTAGKQTTVTYKGPSIPGRHKHREEIETQVSDAGAFETILDRLGFSATFTYEKYRTEYRSPYERGVVTIDETPIGNFLEIEGGAGWIDRTARTLGFRAQDYVTDSYGALYLRFCEERNIRPANMVFPAKKK